MTNLSYLGPYYTLTCTGHDPYNAYYKPQMNKINRRVLRGHTRPKDHDDLHSATLTLAEWATEVSLTSSQLLLTGLQGSLA